MIYVLFINITGAANLFPNHHTPAHPSRAQACRDQISHTDHLPARGRPKDHQPHALLHHHLLQLLLRLLPGADRLHEPHLADHHRLPAHAASNRQVNVQPRQ